MKLTQEYLKKCLTYDPDSGIFIWEIRPLCHFNDRERQTKEHICNMWNAIYAGTKAGYKDTQGYIVIGINSKLYKAHRLAWLYEKGYLPENKIDHLDRIRDNNRIINLREVSDTCSMQNTGNFKNNTSGVKGVSIHKKSNKWQVQIGIRGKNKHLGLFTNFEDAVLARWKEERDNPKWNCHTDSSAYNYLKENNLLETKEILDTFLKR